MAVSDTVSPPNEFTTDSERARLDHCSTDNIIPTKDLFQLGGVRNGIDCDNPSSNLQMPTTSCSNQAGNITTKDGSRSNMQHKLKLNRKQRGQLVLFAGYIHPMPISMVQLIVRENEIFTCVMCGFSEHNDNILFVYKASRNEEKMGGPSLVGHAPIALQITKGTPGRDVRRNDNIIFLCSFLFLLSLLGLSFFRILNG